MTAFNKADFRRNDAGTVLTAFLSDLGIRANDPSYLTWAASGIALKSAEGVTWWYLVRDNEFTNSDYSLGVAGWRFKPTNEHDPAVAGFNLVVFND
jgi:hypothetical protein